MIYLQNIKAKYADAWKVLNTFCMFLRKIQLSCEQKNITISIFVLYTTTSKNVQRLSLQALFAIFCNCTKEVCTFYLTIFICYLSIAYRFVCARARHTHCFEALWVSRRWYLCLEINFTANNKTTCLSNVNLPYRVSLWFYDVFIPIRNATVKLYLSS